MQIPRSGEHRSRRALRMLLSHYVTTGLSAALGLLLVSVSVHQFAGAFAASAAVGHAMVWRQ